jgi:hypothetical protein
MYEETVAINYEWAQVAAAKEIESYESKDIIRLTDEMFKTIKKNTGKIDLGIDVCKLT